MLRLGKALLLAALLLLLSSPALAAGEAVVRFYDGREESAACVELYRTNGKHYLFLPAAWDRACLRVAYTGHEQLYAGETLLANGGITDVFASGNELVLTDARGREQYKVLIYQGSLPCALITTDSGGTRYIHGDKEHREPGTMVLQETSGSVTYHGALEEIRVRGNTTAEYDKKPYQIKLGKKAELIEGAGKAKTWVLLADHTDLSLLRNRVTLHLAQEIGLEYSVSCRSVDVYLNGIYRGVYLLTEKVQAKTNRVEIDDQETLAAMLNPSQPLSSFDRRKRTYNGTDIAWYDLPNQVEDVSGDYLLEIDKAGRVRREPEDGFCFTKQGFGVAIKAPEQPSRNQAEYVSDLMNALERAIFSQDGVDPETGKRYDEIIDVDSFALKYILEEFSANYDAKAGSQYFYKLSDEKGGKLYAGPAWDYDLTYASSVNMRYDAPYFTMEHVRDSWYAALYRHPDFRQRVYELYEERVRPALDRLNGEVLDAYAQEIAQSAQMNFVYNKTAGVKGAHYRTGHTHDEAVAYLKAFVLGRTSALGAYYREHK